MTVPVSRILGSSCLVLALAAVAGAEPGVVESPAEPPGGTVELAVEEVWRAGGLDDDEVLLGVIGEVATDPEGRLLMADIQLGEVHVFAPDGTLQGTVGRQGDGPGEVRNLGGVVVWPDGTVGLVQRFPGRIVRVDREGLPAGEIQPVWDTGSKGGFLMLQDVRLHGDQVVVSGRRMSRDEQKMTVVNFIAGLDAGGGRDHVYLQEEIEREAGRMMVDELEMDSAAGGRWAVAADGRLIIAPERNEYRIEIHGPEGPQQVLTRPYTSRKRTTAETRRAEARLRPRGRGGRRGRDVTVNVAGTEPDILRLWPLPDGRLWVETSRSAGKPPGGALRTYDEFGPDGRFQRRVKVACPGDPDHDALFPVSAECFVLVRGHVDALIAMQGLGDEEDSADDLMAEPLEIIYFRVAN